MRLPRILIWNGESRRNEPLSKGKLAYVDGKGAEPRWPNYLVGEVLVGSSTARTVGSREAPEITA